MDGFSLNLSWKRLLVLAALLLLYFFLGGFTPPSAGSMAKPWMYMLVLFCSGAIAATVVDHEYGMFPPSNLRPLYILLGVILMAAALAWMYSIREHVEQTREQAHLSQPHAARDAAGWSWRSRASP